MFACDNAYPTAAEELYPLIKSQMEALVAAIIPAAEVMIISTSGMEEISNG